MLLDLFNQRQTTALGERQVHDQDIGLVLANGLERIVTVAHTGFDRKIRRLLKVMSPIRIQHDRMRISQYQFNAHGVCSF